MPTSTQKTRRPSLRPRTRPQSRSWCLGLSLAILVLSWPLSHSASLTPILALSTAVPVVLKMGEKVVSPRSPFPSHFTRQGWG